MEDRQESLAGTLSAAWSLIEDGAAGRNPAARLLTLATAGLGGGAEARIVVLRGADRARARLELHSDRDSAKIAEIAAEPMAALLLWDPDQALQIRLRVRIAVETGAGADAQWARVPGPARSVYGGRPPPGRAIARPEDHEPGADRDRFVVLACMAVEIETLRLGQARHRRALFTAAGSWAGRWIAP